jgi:hypothetical protein
MFLPAQGKKNKNLPTLPVAATAVAHFANKNITKSQGALSTTGMGPQRLPVKIAHVFKKNVRAKAKLAYCMHTFEVVVDAPLARAAHQRQALQVLFRQLAGRHARRDSRCMAWC